MATATRPPAWNCSRIAGMTEADPIRGKMPRYRALRLSTGFLALYSGAILHEVKAAQWTGLTCASIIFRVYREAARLRCCAFVCRSAGCSRSAPG